MDRPALFYVRLVRGPLHLGCKACAFLRCRVSSANSLPPTASSELPHPRSSKFPCPNSPTSNHTSFLNRLLRTLCYPFHISWKVLLLSVPQPRHHPSFAFVILFLSERLYYFLVTTSQQPSYLFVSISARYFRIRKDHGASQPTDQPQIYVYLC